MAKKELGYVELEWTCPACGTRNPGPKKICGGCGGAQPEDVEFDQPEGAELDTSKETAAKVAAGPDIHCPYCGTRNPATAKHCSQCGGDLTGGEKRKKGRVVGAYKKGAVPDVACPHCGAKNPGTARKCKSCGGSLTREKVVKRVPVRKGGGVATPVKAKKGIFGCFILAFILMVAAGIFLTRGCSESAGVVQDVKWTYTIKIDALVPVTHEAWRDEVPVGARIGNCTRKVRSIEQEPVPGAVEVCGTPYVEDTGTGTGKVVQDCEYHVSDDWCTYTVMEWTEAVSEEVATGNDFNPRWPVVRLGSDQREGKRIERYTVTFLADDKTYKYGPRSLSEFRKFEVGSRWDVTTNALGGVTSVTAR